VAHLRPRQRLILDGSPQERIQPLDIRSGKRRVVRSDLVDDSVEGNECVLQSVVSRKGSLLGIAAA
jgi:hypothetical protein